MFAKGATRAVFCVGPVAFKFARSSHGALCNRYEADLYRRSEPQRRALLCPPLWCSPAGAVLVMRRARLLTEDYFFMSRQAFLETEPMQRVLDIVKGREFHKAVAALPGYKATNTGAVYTVKEFLDQVDAIGR